MTPPTVPSARRTSRPTQQPRTARAPRWRGAGSAEAFLQLCPSFYREAEQREAPAWYEDLTDGGRYSAVQAVARFPWTSEALASRAVPFAKMLDLLPRARSVVAWSCVVCELLGVMLEDLSPAFRRVRSDAFDTLGTGFSLVPFRGRFGWRRRARFAGLRVRKK